MGILGLDDLLYYARIYPDSAQNVLTSSRHLVSWYPLAISGIHITRFAVQTLRTRQLQYFLFQYGTTKEVYHEFYCRFFHSLACGLSYVLVGIKSSVFGTLIYPTRRYHRFGL